MENTAQDAYLNSPDSRQRQFHDASTPHCATSPTSTCSETTIRPHHIEPPAYTNAPCLDSLQLPYRANSPTSPTATCHPSHHQPLTFQVFTPNDNLISTTSPNRTSYSNDENTDDEDVPLAQLPLYHRDAPPAYSAVVWQSYRETLLQHIPRHSVVVDMDEEAGLEMLRADDVRFQVERVVAMAVVMALLVLTGLLFGLLFVRN